VVYAWGNVNQEPITGSGHLNADAQFPDTQAQLYDSAPPKTIVNIAGAYLEVITVTNAAGQVVATQADCLTWAKGSILTVNVLTNFLIFGTSTKAEAATLCPQ
jgi:hypothetical protein